MRKLVSTTFKMERALDRIKLEGMTLTSITDKTMTSLSVEEISVGEITGLTIFEGVDEDTGEEFNTAVVSTHDKNYSSGSVVLLNRIEELIDAISDGDCSVDEFGFRFGFSTTNSGNKCLSVDII